MSTSFELRRSQWTNRRRNGNTPNEGVQQWTEGKVSLYTNNLQKIQAVQEAMSLMTATEKGRQIAESDGQAANVTPPFRAARGPDSKITIESSVQCRKPSSPTTSTEGRIEIAAIEAQFRKAVHRFAEGSNAIVESCRQRNRQCAYKISTQDRIQTDVTVRVI
jgi:hypothetical protein